ncbi:hypothetical protein DL769_003887 [Monosporascus sp. CRB-8-3]|nr:hypothetical protein DL769_003887 [Monosporascus sp. CRB-8-3]
MTTWGSRRGAPATGRGGLGQMRPVRRLKTHVLPFMDHAGGAACIVFEGREACPLSPLYGIAIYFTHPDASHDTANPEVLFDAIRRDTPLSNHCPIRLEFFFNPSAAGAEIGACIAHYRAEKSLRGDYRRQIQAVESSTETDNDERARVQRLPGMVSSYVNHPSIKYYHGLLYICLDQDWRAGRRVMRRVHFDPISQEQYAALTQDSGEHETLAPTYLAWDAIERGDANLQGPGLVGMRLLRCHS